MAASDYYSAHALTQRDLGERQAEAASAHLLDADLAALGQRSVALDALAEPDATPAEVLALARLTWGMVHRAGLLDAFRTLAAVEAAQRGDRHTLAALRASAPVRSGSGSPGSRSVDAGTAARWQEEAARDLAAGSTAPAPAQEDAAARWTSFNDADAARGDLGALHLDGRPVPALRDPEGTGRELSGRFIDRTTARLAQEVDHEEERQRSR